MFTDAGVVEREVETPEALDRLHQRGLHVAAARHIAFYRERTPAGLFAYADGKRFESGYFIGRRFYLRHCYLQNALYATACRP